MKTFLEFIESTDSYSKDYLKTLYLKNFLGSGKFANVYSTQDDNIVMRVEKIRSPKELENIKPEFHDQSCEKFMSKPEVQATGGVAKIYGFDTREYDFNDERNPIFITYKEKVNTNWFEFFYDKDKEKALDLKTFLHHAKNIEKDKIIEKLNMFPVETAGLVRAIQMGLPLGDLHESNLGLNKLNKLVVIDC